MNVQYMISEGTLDWLGATPAAKTIPATITGIEEGELTILLPRELSDSIDENGDDSDYVVKVDGSVEPDTVDDFGEDVRMLIIPFASDSGQIDITGTFLVLESTED